MGDGGGSGLYRARLWETLASPIAGGLTLQHFANRAKPWQAERDGLL